MSDEAAEDGLQALARHNYERATYWQERAAKAETMLTVALDELRAGNYITAHGMLSDFMEAAGR